MTAFFSEDGASPLFKNPLNSYLVSPRVDTGLHACDYLRFTDR